MRNGAPTANITPRGQGSIEQYIETVPKNLQLGLPVSTANWCHFRTVVEDHDMEMIPTASTARGGNVAWLVHTQMVGFLRGECVALALSLFPWNLSLMLITVPARRVTCLYISH